jgi:hypothetical protein
VEFWVGLFVIIVIFGALAGGRSFGGTISKGVGCLFIIIFGIVILVALTES